ncbi:hypothetical protein CSC70_07825 [Pseudoxanthomonas kalamensis DSM 18571]|uniref:DUF4097 domain-containing protein n=1 Tax=Pseudoxanthomonas kalamensis TaxID=289483 RepID=UPI001391C6A1|nr:DUF4097 domain-containing protein [Pseudoxanthomonas kalamensis]KAF1710559.1 hypothetical protein CSC70_07825 [Pseudoxanthomonas kalamensis DSM 18571]
MHRSILLSLLLLPGVALADECQHSRPLDLRLDLDGVKTVRFEIANHELKLVADGGNRVGGRAYASDPAYLDQLVVEQRRQGDKLIVSAHREGKSSGVFLRNNYAYLQLQAGVPRELMVQLQVGSGDASVSGPASLSVDLGSGDVQASRIRGLVTAKIGSGDLELDDVGPLHVLSIGSGDLEAKSLRGNVEVGSIGSGDLTLQQVAGSVDIGSIGSGDAEVSGADGLVHVRSIGSGDLDVSGSRGGVTVDSIGSGDVGLHDVTGPINLPRR